MKKIISKNTQQTLQIAERLAKSVKPGTILLLKGPLGSGKTTFVQGFARSLGIKNNLTSPTFVLMKPYPLPNHTGTLYHLDLYRIGIQTDFEELGLSEIVKRKDVYILVEWPERAKNIFPPKSKVITFSFGKNPEERIIKFN